MFLIIIFVSVSVAFLGIAYRQYSVKKKYLDTKNLTNLNLAKNFINYIENLNDYTTWVERDRIKSRYASTGQFFKNRTNFYKKENPKYVFAFCKKFRV